MNFTTRLILHRRLMRLSLRRRRQGSKKKSRAAATPAFLLPQDVLASILIRLPGSDLRRLRRVCREWRDLISDRTFIRAHMVRKPWLPSTHTIVFFPGFTYGSRQEPGNGRGFLFDEHWRLNAEFTAGRWDNLIGACNGLLCFLDPRQGSIKIVEPFTGESLVVPRLADAPVLRSTLNSAEYCFGFDATASRYKIVHHGYLQSSTRTPREGEAVDDEELHVYTVGGGKGWTRVHLAHAVHGAYANPLYIDGAVYWPSQCYEKAGRYEKLVRFDLATEKITSEVHRPRPKDPMFCRLVDSMSCVTTNNSHWNVWFPEAEEDGASYLSDKRVLLSDWTDCGLYLRTMKRRLQRYGRKKLLFKVSKDQPPVDRQVRWSNVVRPGSSSPAAPNSRSPAGMETVLCEDVWVRPHGGTCSISALLIRHALSSVAN